MLDSSTADICIANIGPRERAFRMRLGVTALTVAAAGAGVLTAAGVRTRWRAALFPLFWLGTASIEEARQQTCVRFAARGTRKLDAPEETFTDDVERRAVRRQARRVLLTSAVEALALTAVAVAAGGKLGWRS